MAANGGHGIYHYSIDNCAVESTIYNCTIADNAYDGIYSFTDHDTGGIHDTVTDLNVKENTGNGFLFKNFDSNGLMWAIRQAMSFYNLAREEKKKQIKRIMTESAASFTHAHTAREYIQLYEKMLKRPLINATTKPESKPETDIK